MADKDPYDHLVPPPELGGPEIDMTPPEPPQYPQRAPIGPGQLHYGTEDQTPSPALPMPHRDPITVNVTVSGPQDGQGIKFDERLRTPPESPRHTAPAGTNPKDRLGLAKVSLSKNPPAASIYMALAMMNGAEKYGAFNWRANPVIASIYIDACKRHLDAWWDGEELADDSKVPHLGHALASIAILVDALETGNLVDDRPIAGAAAALFKKYTVAK